MQRIFTIILFLFFSVTSVVAQGYRGNDFWVCFPGDTPSNSHDTLSLSIYIAAEIRSTGTIENMTDSSSTPFSVEGGSAIEIPIDNRTELRFSERTEQKPLHITSDHDIAVYVVSHRPGGADGYVAIPTNLLGVRYVAVGYSAMTSGRDTFVTQSEIVATEDNTLVQAKLTAGAENGLPRGRTIEFALNRGDVFHLSGSASGALGDLTGTIFTSNKPVAFFTGHSFAGVLPKGSRYPLLLTMEPPQRDWGRDFILTKFEGKDSYALRVIADTDSTDVSLNGRHVATLAKSDFYECDTLTTDAEVTSSKPVLVTQYVAGLSADTNVAGASSMLFVIPSGRFIREVTTTSLSPGIFNNYLNIVLPRSARSALQIDGAPVILSDSSRWFGRLRERIAADGAFDIISVELREGRHLVQCSEPIAVYSYGAGVEGRPFDFYAHACGMRLDR